MAQRKSRTISSLLFILGTAVVLFISISADSKQRDDFDYRVTRGRAALLWSIQGEGRYLGMQDAVALDDYDGDGAPEILTRSFDGTSQRTFFHIVSGKSGRVIRSYSLRFNRTFAGGADFDGNGKKDIALSTYISDGSGNPPSSSGGTYLISILNPDFGRIIWKRSSNVAEPGFGANVFVTSDANDDGISDLLVSSHFNDDRLPRIHYISGRDGKTFRTVDAPAGSSSFFGTAISNSMVNNDSKADLITTDILFAKNPTTVEARVWALNGTNNKRIWSQGRLPDSLFGDKVRIISDLNSDGISDLIVTAPNQGRAVRGAVHAISGANGKTLWIRPGTVDSGQFGRAITILNDITGDGISEIVVGSPASLPPMLAAGVPGSFTILNGRDGSNLIIVEEILPNRRAFSTHFAIHVRSAGDLNGDGREDLLVAAPDFGRSDQGRAPAGLVAAFTLN
ncbi:MAG TPA: hypothetical protein VLH08_20915 [Acidobacteriota bacterium]|nr:hypothetical protein [Acidobacteriota bacterium]